MMRFLRGGDIEQPTLFLVGCQTKTNYQDNFNQPRKPNDEELSQLTFFLMLTEKFGSHIPNRGERLGYIEAEVEKAYIAVFDRHPNYPDLAPDERESFMVVVWPTGANNVEVYDFSDGGNIGRIVPNQEIQRFSP